MYPINSNKLSATIRFQEQLAVHFSKFAVCLLCLFLLFSKVQAQGKVDYSIHANIIYHFTKYIEWPSLSNKGNFVIGIIGDSPIQEELEIAVANKKAGNQNIIVRRFTASAASYNCHILFISGDESHNIKKIVNVTKFKPVLLVTESYGLAQKGGCINFTIASEKLKLEINKNNIETRSLSIASDLLKLGKTVD